MRRFIKYFLYQFSCLHTAFQSWSIKFLLKRSGILIKAYHIHPICYQCLFYLLGGGLFPRSRVRPYTGDIKSYRDYAYMVAGLGRCGTKLVRFSMSAVIKSWKLPDKKVSPGFKVMLSPESKQVMDFPRITPGIVLKTHLPDPASLNMPDNVKVIWMFGNPFDIVVSSISIGALHYHNMGSPYWHKHKDIFIYDTLMLEKHFDAWYRPQKFEFLSVRYETLYKPEALEAISDFLNWKLVLPKWRDRKSNWKEHARRQDIETTYASLYAKVLAAEDVKWWKSSDNLA